MKKYTYQTCLRLSETLKEDMTAICDSYHINESDFMRHAIAESVQSMRENPNDESRKYMFV